MSFPSAPTFPAAPTFKSSPSFPVATFVVPLAVPFASLGPFLDNTSPEVGDTLTISTVTWENSPTSHAYQWLRDGVEIGGATSINYTATEADIGAVLSVRDTATNIAGSGSATSDEADPVISGNLRTHIKSWSVDGDWIYDTVNPFSPLPSAGDLVRLTGGTNAVVQLYRIDLAFAAFDTGADGPQNMIHRTGAYASSGQVANGTGGEIIAGISKRVAVFDGDSITLGMVNLANPTPNTYLNPPILIPDTFWMCINKGVGGATLADMEADASSDIDPLFASGGVVFCWGGTNDIELGASAATTISRLHTYCANRKAAGWKVAVITIMPRTSGVPTFEADRATVIADILDGSHLGVLWDATINLAGTGMGDAGDNLGPNFYDGTHPSNLGYQSVIFPRIKTTLESI